MIRRSSPAGTRSILITLTFSIITLTFSIIKFSGFENSLDR
ncbi:hypothetical protein Aazo_0371 ['Nostoc azollae' 0708]|uniref:Uncharacterized protein n=1 Tax=Nostoc azollae (strain 0708) TaxID=551115 RepID=D7DZI9_NOSA0|nr:hypothetical protein Aazo_0371 ['Nostoc azollae' 0708]